MEGCIVEDNNNSSIHELSDKNGDHGVIGLSCYSLQTKGLDKLDKDDFEDEVNSDNHH